MRLRVYDVSARLVRTLVEEDRRPGRHAAVWNGRTREGDRVVPGVYFLRLEAGAFQANRKVVFER